MLPRSQGCTIGFDEHVVVFSLRSGKKQARRPCKTSPLSTSSNCSCPRRRLSAPALDLDRRQLLEASKCERRSAVADAGDAIELLAQETLIACGAFNGPLHQIVVAARGEIGFDHLGQL